MTTIRVAHRKRYASISRDAINDQRLSFRARGVLTWLLDKPNDWTSTAERISSMGKEGRDAIRAALDELEACGYLIRRKWRDEESGKWSSEWTVYEKPPCEEPGRETSAGHQLDHDGFPATENQRRETSPLTKDLELNTEIESPSASHLEERRSRANPMCPSCDGSGTRYHAGAGREGPCECTKPLAKIRDA